MIVFQGCSFTYGSGLANPELEAYPNIFKKKTQQEIYNISEPSKDNFYSYFQLSAYLLHGNRPKVVVWQLADMMRVGMPDYTASGSWKPNDLQSIVNTDPTDYHKRFIKTICWEVMALIEGTGRQSKYGMGTCLAVEGHDWPIGDRSFNLNHLQMGVNIYNIQQLCKSLDIKLVIIPYFEIDESILNDPIYQAIDMSDFLIDPKVTGMYEHLLSLGFDQTDEYHFDVAAHLYQADLLKKYLEKGIKPKVHKSTSDTTPTFDYTEHSNVADVGKAFLIHTLKNKK